MKQSSTIKQPDVYNYRGHQAKLSISNRIVRLNSQFINAKSEEVTREDDQQVIYNMYRRWFEESVDEFLASATKQEQVGMKVA